MKRDGRHLLNLATMATLSALAGAFGGMAIDEAMHPSSVTAAMLGGFEPGTVPTGAKARAAAQPDGAAAADTLIVAGIGPDGFGPRLDPCPAAGAQRWATYVEQGKEGPQLVLIALDRAGSVVDAQTIVLTTIE